MSVSPRMTGIVSERPRPKVLDYTGILERDLGIALDENERLKNLNKKLRRRVERLEAQAKARHRWTGVNPKLVEYVRQMDSLGRVPIASGVVLDSDAWRLTYPAGSVQFSPSEWMLLRILVVSKGQVVPKSELAENLRAYTHCDSNGAEHAVNVYINRVRAKLRIVGVGHLITTIPYSGYRFEAMS